MTEQKLCAGCGIPLSRYNTMSLCGSCSKAGPRALIPSDLWQQPQIIAALKNYDFGRVCSALREQTPLTQRQIAEMVGLDQSGLSRLEHAKQRVTHMDVFVRFIQGLGIPPELVLPPELHVERKDDSVERRSFIAGAAGVPPTLAISAANNKAQEPIRIGLSELQTLHGMLKDLSWLDDQLGGDRLLGLAQWQLRLVQAAFDNNHFDRKMGGELQRIAGELRTSIGWYAFDSNKQNQARSNFSEALNIATLNGDHFLTTRTIALMARQTIDLGRGQETVHLAQQASSNAGIHVTPYLRALIAMREANGWALQGDKKACETAIGLAHDEFAAGPNDDDPAWISRNMSKPELERLEGMSRASLGQYAKAENLLERATLGLQKEGLRRNLGVCLIQLSTNSVKLGKLDQAAAHAQKAKSLIGNLTSTRVHSQLKELKHHFSPHQKTRVIRETLEELDI